MLVAALFFEIAKEDLLEAIDFNFDLVLTQVNISDLNALDTEVSVINPYFVSIGHDI